MSPFKALGLLLKAKRVETELAKASKEGRVSTLLRAFGHLVAASAPAIGGYAATEIARALSSSHEPVFVAVGTLIGAIVPLLRNFGTDTTAAQSLVNTGNR